VRERTVLLLNKFWNVCPRVTLNFFQSKLIVHENMDTISLERNVSKFG